MKIIKESHFEHIFPMQIKCQRVVDCHGFAYGDAKDFCGSELEIEAEDIKAHDWHKYPNITGLDYGVVCPICGQFIVIDRKLIPKTVLNNAKQIKLN